MPFLTDEKKQELTAMADMDDGEEMRRASTRIPVWQWYEGSRAKAYSVACCASTSYKTVEGFDMDWDNAQRIHDGLRDSDPMHASPFEHVAKADRYMVDEWGSQQEHGNYTGFRQYRRMLPGGIV
jgi:hypothetical protein